MALALFIGDVMIERCPNLKWVMFDKGTKNVAYQRHVLMGFTKVANPKYNVDPDLNLATYGHCIVGDIDVEDDKFVIWVRWVQSVC